MEQWNLLMNTEACLFDFLAADMLVVFSYWYVNIGHNLAFAHFIVSWPLFTWEIISDLVKNVENVAEC